MSSPKTTLKPNGELTFLIAMEAAFVFLTMWTLRYSFVAALLPGLVLIGILGLLTALLVRELVRTRRGAVAGDDRSGETTTEEAAAAETERKGARSRELEIIGWLVLQVVLVYLLGFMVAIPLFMLLFLRVRFGISWLKTVAVTVGLTAGVYLVFVFWLHTMLYGGLLEALLAPH